MQQKWIIEKTFFTKIFHYDRFLSVELRQGLYVICVIKVAPTFDIKKFLFFNSMFVSLILCEMNLLYIKSFQPMQLYAADEDSLN